MSRACIVQPIGAVMPLPEIQSEWVADLLQGRTALPPERQMNREIARYTAVTAKRYGRSARHAIQVDFLAYLREISRERRKEATGERRMSATPSGAPGGALGADQPVALTRLTAGDRAALAGPGLPGPAPTRRRSIGRAVMARQPSSCGHGRAV